MYTGFHNVENFYLIQRVSVHEPSFLPQICFIELELTWIRQYPLLENTKKTIPVNKNRNRKP